MKHNEVQVFGSLTDKEIEDFYAFCEIETHKKNSIIFKDKSEDSSVYIILKGSIEIFIKKPKKEKILFAKIGEGCVFGELSFIDNLPRSASVKATNDCKVLKLTQESFSALKEQKPAIANKLLIDLSKVIALRLRQSDETVIDLVSLIEAKEA